MDIFAYCYYYLSCIIVVLIFFISSCILLTYFLFLICRAVYNWVDKLNYEFYETSGIVIDKCYISDVNSTRAGEQFCTEAGFIPSIYDRATSIINLSKENWMFNIKLDSGEIVSITTNYSPIKIGDIVNVHYHVYWLSKKKGNFGMLK